jgi:L-amino acid N-acyltransferase YncA
MKKHANARIRPTTPADAAAISRIYEPIVRSTSISFEIEPPTPAIIHDRICASIEMYPWLSAELEGAVVGYAYAGRHRERAAYRWSVDVSAYVHQDFRGQGIGRALYERLFQILRKQRFRSAFAGIALPNDASVGLHEALGFEPVGIYHDVGFKLGGWHQVGWWRLGLSSDPAPPTEPIPFAVLTEPRG